MIQPQDWRPVGGFVLEANAMSAVRTTDRNVVVAAGPGAGKTELLAQRADYLLRTGACAYPRRILAISFKVDAARNLAERVRTRSGAQQAARFDSLTFHAFAKRLIDNYRPALCGANELKPGYRVHKDVRLHREQITFDDMVPLALEILTSNRFARGAIRHTYSHVFLDEFQDATENQYKLVRFAFRNTPAVLTAVGDVKQRIMVFAGALDGIMSTFRHDFDAVELPLYLNFRSAPRLRRMQTRMIRDMDPSAASPDSALAGNEGVIEVVHCADQFDEAERVADLVEEWLDDVAPSEIAILVRQRPQQVAEDLVAELLGRGIPHHIEQNDEDLTNDPIALLIFNFIRVVAADRRPDAYTELLRVVSRASGPEEAALRFDSKLRQHLRSTRTIVRSSSFDNGSAEAWESVVLAFLRLISRPVLVAMSSAYLRTDQLENAIKKALDTFGEELALDGDPIQALKRLSELDAVRILTIHKSKGLEFEKVVVLGVEEQFFWGETAMPEFFVAISRAKNELVLTCTILRTRPRTQVKSWKMARTAHQRLLDYAYEPGLTARWMPASNDWNDRVV